MKLNIIERITLQGILPQTGNYINYRIINDLRSELSFNEKEIKEWGIKTTPKADGTDFITWDGSKVREKDVMIGAAAHALIVTELKKLDEKEGINAQNVSLYEKFILNPKQDGKQQNE